MARLWAIQSTGATLAPSVAMLPVLALVIDYVVGRHLDYLIDGVRHQDGVKVCYPRVLSHGVLL